MSSSNVSMPVFAPLYIPGTERVTVRWLTVDIPVSHDISVRVLPEQLRPAEHPTLGLWIAEFIGAEFISDSGTERRPNYLQGGVSLRCRYDDGNDGAYAIETFVEGLNHGILGREIFGLPKKQAQQVRLDEDENNITFGIVSALGHALVTGATTAGDLAPAGTTPVPDWFERHFTVKAIPSAEGDGYDICKLVEIPWKATPQGRTSYGEADLTWRRSTSDPLHLFHPHGPVTTAYGHATLEIDYGTYLANVSPPAPVGTPSWD